MRDKIKGVITWLYYRDLPVAVEFYKNVMGFKMKVDQGWSKIFKINDGSYVGLVDGKHGYHQASEIRPVILCINVSDADEWHRMLIEKGLALEMQPKESKRLKIKVFMFKDPEGYIIEIQETLPGGCSI
ncbi:MAG: VOC family protein [Candidatus Bathyarchaeota archaeon]|jgi:predicted enzyme related to lactoylglutathione lyase|nr:VOC family protein [Candidatus Bathyarchaeota archaeon]